MTSQVINLREFALERYMEMHSEVETMLQRVDELTNKGFKREAGRLIEKADKIKEKMLFYKRKLRDFKKFYSSVVIVTNVGGMSFNRYSNFYGSGANEAGITTLQGDNS